MDCCSMYTHGIQRLENHTEEAAEHQVLCAESGAGCQECLAVARSTASAVLSGDERARMGKRGLPHQCCATRMSLTIFLPFTALHTHHDYISVSFFLSLSIPHHTRCIHDKTDTRRAHALTALPFVPRHSMKVFDRLGSRTPPPKSDETPTTQVEISADATGKHFKEAMKAHRKAMKELRTCAESFAVALENVARSFQRLAADTRAPVVVQASGALARGVTEVREGVVLDSFLEEVQQSLTLRFAAVLDEHAALDECRRRKTKAEKALADARGQCAKLATRNEVNTGTGSKSNGGYGAEAQKCDAQLIDYQRLAAEYEDALREFTRHVGSCVYTDMTEMATETHRLLSSLSYQFRKCEENLKAHPPPQITTVCVA